jgi:hypothetical protein
MYLHKLVLALAGSVLLSACATIVTGTTQTIKVDSNPQGARIFTAEKTTEHGKTVYANRAEAGVTPGTVAIPRKDGAVLLEKDGYEPTEVPLNRRMAGWVWGDIVLLSLLSTSIDTSTGAAKEYDPREYLVEMKAINK